MVEGGGEVFGTLLATRSIDEVLAFIAPLIIGGKDAPSVVAGPGIGPLADALRLGKLTVRSCGVDAYLSGRK